MFRVLTTVAMLMVWPFVNAATESVEKLPDQLIVDVTDSLLAAVEEARPTFAQDPDPFYSKVEDLVLPLMDMRSFARGVMGRHGSTKAYRALKTAEEKEAFKARIVRFADVFKTSMVRTYAKGLMTFTGQAIDVVPLDDKQIAELTKTGRIEVVQLVARENDEPYELRYSFARNKKGEWLARNLLVDGINLGRVYQSQFAQAVIDNDGDVDAAIKNWVITLATDDTTETASNGA